MTAALALALLVLGAITTVLGLVAAVLGLLNQHRIMKVAAEQTQTGAKVQEISVSVDGNVSGMIGRIDQLVASMHAQGAVVPIAPPAPAESGEKPAP
jgi:acetylglutamate kinase